MDDVTIQHGFATIEGDRWPLPITIQPHSEIDPAHLRIEIMMEGDIVTEVARISESDALLLGRFLTAVFQHAGPESEGEKVCRLAQAMVAAVDHVVELAPGRVWPLTQEGDYMRSGYNLAIRHIVEAMKVAVTEPVDK